MLKSLGVLPPKAAVKRRGVRHYRGAVLVLPHGLGGTWGPILEGAAPGEASPAAPRRAVRQELAKKGMLPLDYDGQNCT